MKVVAHVLVLAMFLLGGRFATAQVNLLVIVTDDQGRWAMGAYGNEEIHTPHMDRIAAEGALFTQAFVATPVCSPSRATFMTGLYPTELGITDWISPEQARDGLGLAAETWPQTLQRNGYQTALFGKWHLGALPQFHPAELGYAHFTGFLDGGARPMDPTLEVDGEDTKLEGPLPDILADRTIDWLERHHEHPFLISLHFRAPHLPYGPVPKADSRHYADLDPTVPRFPGMDEEKVKQSTKAYYASVSSIDRNIGRVLDALDRLELADDTVVVFTSDHGYNEGRHGIDTKGNGQWIAGGVRGPKRPNMWDTSLVVPLAVRWPGIVDPGTRIDHPVSNLDMYRTVLGAVGIPISEDSKARGIDFSPLLRGETLPQREALFGQYDLHNNGLAYLRMVRTDRYKYVRHFHAYMQDEVYDLVEDPGETRNLAGRRPRIDKDVLAELQAKLHAWMVSIDDPLLRDPY